MAVHPVSHTAPPPPVTHNAPPPKPPANTDKGGHVTETRGTKVNKTA